ncbi:hypothetical protein [Paraliobacillus ryukyuensis]|uniref:hypothetical protein n=1 Tax=Paraliobacillus ryukyuensis TaxID=200904 RepID=UPI0009A903B8|nr:hypothetical protein [Paraliobacillus ryukyuensis]
MAELDMDKKVEIKNLCDWDLYFTRVESNGHVRIPRSGKTRISRAEIQAQVFDNNKMFVGTDGNGSHARIYVEDKETRDFLEFDKGNSKQKILDSEAVKKLLELKTQSSFEKNVKEKVKTKAEKNYLIEESKRQKLNDFNKIKFIEDYTGYKFDTK